MNIEQNPPWSGKKLAKLGVAIMEGVTPPGDCPEYSAVMEWHSDLCAEVALQIGAIEPPLAGLVNFDVSARAKTLDTLRDKLIREQNLRLNQVQDVAGVRVDMDGTLSDQTAAAEAVRQLFGTERSTVKDLRDAPHSGYRAVHVWLRLPAGRTEVQIRTRGQSAWANVYERLGDLVGRHIRYGSPGATEPERVVVASLQKASESLAHTERIQQEVVDLGEQIEDHIRKIDLLGPDLAGEEWVESLKRAAQASTQRQADLRIEADKGVADYVESLRELERMLDDIGPE